MTVTRGVVQPQTNPVPLRICLGGEDSGGRLAVVEMALDPPSGPPLRLHPTHGERFDVLAGKLTLQLGEEIVTGGPGPGRSRHRTSRPSGRPPNRKPAYSGHP
jgi:quercetin dioxygenase-like cupin family protein